VVRKIGWLAIPAASALAIIGQSLMVAADTSPQPVNFTHNVIDAPAPVPNTAFDMPTTPVAAGVAICTTATSNAANVSTDCNDNGTAGPHNETSIAVNPKNPMNIIGGANDYQLTLNPDGHVSESILSRAHVSFDGGQTWSMFGVNSSSTYQATGDPSIAFDDSGHAYYATLGFRFVGPFNAENPDVLVSNSGDGGKSWNEVRVASGSGVETSVGDLLDKEYVKAWDAGHAIVTFGDFKLGPHGGLIASFILSSVTRDFGAHWTSPVVISGSDNEAFVSTPTVTADGRIFVSYLNTRNLTNGRDDVRVVEVSPTTGAALGPPVTVQQEIIDGFTDYPIAFFRQTYQDSVFRTWAAGDLTSDPTNGAHLAMIWSDMRNSTLPAPSDPYAATTNSDIIVSQSFDHGATWSAPTALTLSGDQFMPWGAYDTSGRLRIGFFDRSVDSANHKYGYTLATETAPGTLTFTETLVSTVLSDPTTGDRWFARNVSPSFPHATAFLGDYSNIAALPNGGVVAYWTDMRNPATFRGITRQGEDAFFAAVS
jgi:hypothetical protein